MLNAVYVCAMIYVVLYKWQQWFLRFRRVLFDLSGERTPGALG